MINQVFGLLADVFPGLVFITVVAGLFLLARTWSQVSAGSAGAGHALITPASQMGLQKIPWDLHGIQTALEMGSVEPVDQLVRRAKSMGIATHVDSSLTIDQRYDDLLSQVEAALGLPPLPQAAPPQPSHPSEGTP